MTAQKITAPSVAPGRYDAEVLDLVKLLGGAGNVATAIHCVSRLRLVVNDMKLVDDKAIGRLPSVKGTIKLPGGQYHVVIGADVPNFFAAFQKASGVKGAESVTAFKEQAAKKGGKLQWVMQSFSEIFIPIIPVLVAAGLILGVRNLFEADFNGFRLVNWSPVIKGLNDFLWIPAQAGLWFLPVYICWSIFKKMGGNQVVGILIGLSMLINPLENVFAVSGAGGGRVQWIWNLDLSNLGFDFGSWKFPWRISYTAQVIPAMGVAFAAVYIERFLNKWTNPVLRQIIVPLVTVLIAYTLALCAIGPAGWTIGTAISFGVNWALTNEVARYIFAPIFGFFYAPLVVTGLHHMLNAVMAQELTSGGTILFPILCMSNIAQGAACGFMGLAQRRNGKVRSISSSATASAWLGVTEPAMYGINTRFGAPFLGATIGAAAGSLLLVALGVSAAGIGNGAWLGVLSVQVSTGISSGYTTVASAGQAWFVLSGLLTVGVACVLTWVFRRIPRFKKLETANAIDDDPAHIAGAGKRRDVRDVLARWLPGTAALLVFGLAIALVVNPTFAGAADASALPTNDLAGKWRAFGFITGAVVMLLSLPLMFSSVYVNKFYKGRGRSLGTVQFAALMAVTGSLVVLTVVALALAYAA